MSLKLSMDYNPVHLLFVFYLFQLATEFQKPLQESTTQQLSHMNLRYYNSDIHRAAFVLPRLVRDKLEEADNAVHSFS